MKTYMVTVQTQLRVEAYNQQDAENRLEEYLHSDRCHSRKIWLPPKFPVVHNRNDELINLNHVVSLWEYDGGIRLTLSSGNQFYIENPEGLEKIRAHFGNPKCRNDRLEARNLLDAALEAVDHVGQANWVSRQEAVREWLVRIFHGKIDKSLDEIQEEINNR